MDNSTERIYEFSYKIPGYDFVSANAALYSFLGPRLYITADRLLTGGSVDILDKAYEDKAYGQTFIVTVGNTDGSDITMAAQLIRPEAGETAVIKVRMIELNRLFNGYSDLIIREKEYNALLSQSECTYYSYDKKTDMITTYRFDIGKDILGITNAEHWKSDLMNKLSESSAEAVSKFISDLRNGVRSCEYTLSQKEQNKKLVVTGSAVYSDDVHIMTVGRMGDPSQNASHEFNNRDQLTGLFMKENITNYAKRCINDLRQSTAIAIVDIDDFKLVNDNFGHAKGDEVLKRCAAIIEKQVEGFGKAGRIGGDEFFIVFDNFVDKERLKFVLRGIKNMVYAAYDEEQNGFCVTTSIGVSVFPEDVDANYDTMFKLADCLLYKAKKKGKNRYIVYEPTKHGSVESLLESGVKSESLLGGRVMEKSEVICRIANKIISGDEFTFEQILNDVLAYFGIDRIVIYNKTDRKATLQYGKPKLSEKLIEETIDYLYDDRVEMAYDNGVMLVSHIVYFDMKASKAYDALCKQGVESVMQHIVKAKSGKTFVISYEMITSPVTWNETDTQYFRILDKLLFEQYL
ncbi:MAG: GGDEF domain-containing protein [Oscillospiraceae bacterium]|nr:GGDEF domain-containing protein [Oscillospiraceae bacterium]